MKSPLEGGSIHSGTKNYEKNHKILPKLSDRLDEIQQLIYYFQENRPLLTQQIENNTALSRLKNQVATVLTDFHCL